MCGCPGNSGVQQTNAEEICRAAGGAAHSSSCGNVCRAGDDNGNNANGCGQVCRDAFEDSTAPHRLCTNNPRKGRGGWFDERMDGGLPTTGATYANHSFVV